MWPIAAEWLLLRVQRSAALQDDEWQFPAAAVIGLQKLAGGNQPKAGRKGGRCVQLFACPARPALR